MVQEQETGRRPESEQAREGATSQQIRSQALGVAAWELMLTWSWSDSRQREEREEEDAPRCCCCRCRWCQLLNWRQWCRWLAEEASEAEGEMWLPQAQQEWQEMGET